MDVQESCIGITVERTACKEPRHSKSSHFCTYHHHLCIRYYHGYKLTECQANVSQLHPDLFDKTSADYETIKQQIHQTRKTYIMLNRAQYLRQKFRDTYVHPSHHDEGHQRAIIWIQQQQLQCEQHLANLYSLNSTFVGTSQPLDNVETPDYSHNSDNKSEVASDHVVEKDDETTKQQQIQQIQQKKQQQRDAAKRALNDAWNMAQQEYNQRSNMLQQINKLIQDAYWECLQTIHSPSFIEKQRAPLILDNHKIQFDCVVATILFILKYVSNTTRLAIKNNMIGLMNAVYLVYSCRSEPLLLQMVRLLQETDMTLDNTRAIIETVSRNDYMEFIVKLEAASRSNIANFMVQQYNQQQQPVGLGGRGDDDDGDDVKQLDTFTITQSNLDQDASMVQRVLQHHPSAILLHGKYLAIQHDAITSNLYNKQHIYHQCQLTLVIGSLGIGIKKPFYEYGSPSWNTVSQFINSPGRFDMHAWLQDKKSGNIYDIVQDDWIHVAAVHKKSIKFHKSQVIEDMPVTKCQFIGLWYIPASKPIQDKLMSLFLEKYGLLLNKLGIATDM